MLKAVTGRRDRDVRRSSSRSRIGRFEALEDRRLMTADLAQAGDSSMAVSDPSSSSPALVSTLLDRTDGVAITNANIAGLGQDSATIVVSSVSADDTVAIESKRAAVFAAAQPPRAQSGVQVASSRSGGPLRTQPRVQAAAQRANAAIVIQRHRPLSVARAAAAAQPRRMHLTGDARSDQQALVWFRQTHPGPPKETVEMKLDAFGDDVEKFGKKVEKFGRKVGEAFQDIF